MDAPAYEQWALNRMNNASATLQNMPGGPEGDAASARHLTMAIDPRMYEQQMMNYDFANPSGSTMVGRDAMQAKMMPTAAQARRALLESQQRQAAPPGPAAAPQAPAKKKKKKTYTQYGAYEEEVPDEKE